MARDHALALVGPAHGAVLRLYRWREPTVSLGRNELARDRYDRSKLDERRLAVVRRPTGGRAVLHHRELTYALVTPVDGRGSLRAVYRRANRALVRALRALGVAAEMAGQAGLAGSAPGPGAGACFGVPAEHEIVVGGRKLAGSAQVRFGRRVLQHGSLLLHDDQGLLQGLGPGDAVGSRAFESDTPGCVALANLLPSTPSWEEAAEAVVAGFRVEWGGDWTEAAADRSLASEWGTLEEEFRTRYGSEAWTWRR